MEGGLKDIHCNTQKAALNVALLYHLFFRINCTLIILPTNLYYSVFFFMGTKVFVHLTYLKLSQISQTYLKSLFKQISNFKIIKISISKVLDLFYLKLCFCYKTNMYLNLWVWVGNSKWLFRFWKTAFLFR